jgi:cold shock CspA family protein
VTGSAAPAPTGRVASFDEAVGLGTVEASDGRYPFHCTLIADGSRSIAVGTEVTFTVWAGRRGVWEAGDLRPVPGESA